MDVDLRTKNMNAILSSTQTITINKHGKLSHKYKLDQLNSEPPGAPLTYKD